MMKTDFSGFYFNTLPWNLNNRLLFSCFFSSRFPQVTVAFNLQDIITLHTVPGLAIFPSAVACGSSCQPKSLHASGSVRQHTLSSNAMIPVASKIKLFQIPLIHILTHLLLFCCCHFLCSRVASEQMQRAVICQTILRGTAPSICHDGC